MVETGKGGLNHADQLRLLKMLGMLGSSHAGERAAAAWQASRMLRDRGLTWDEVLSRRIGAPSPYGAADLHDRAPQWRQVAARCRQNAKLLTAWEICFLDGLHGQRTLSAEEEEMLCRITDKVLAGTS